MGCKGDHVKGWTMQKLLKLMFLIAAARLSSIRSTFAAALIAGAEYFDPDPAGADDYKMYTRHMGVVEGVKTTFSDSELADFGLLEGSEVDARQVLLYHSAEECLGQAGLGRKDTQGQSIGFFCGLSGNDRYFEWMSGSLKTSKIAASLMSSGGVVNRIAWFYGSKGPSMAVDTEESSGAAALDTAVAYLREDDRCARAIVSGVNWIQLPVSLILCCATGMLSASGRGRAFDESADGNVRSEGVVSVLMEAHGRWRRAAEAEVDEFRPAAEEWDAELQDDMQKHRLLICGSALNSRGQSSSLLAPSSAAIQDLIESALKDKSADAKCPASIVDGVEANAGGNSLSDAVELNILRMCLAAEDAAKTTTSSASVRATKTLIGEPGPPGGLACLARACFTLQKAVSGPLIHLRQLSEIAAAQADDDETLAPKLLLTTEAAFGASRALFFCRPNDYVAVVAAFWLQDIAGTGTLNADAGHHRQGHPRSSIRTLACDWAGKRAITGNDDGYFVMWDLEEQIGQRTLNCKVGMVLSLYPDWNKMRMLVGHKGSITAISVQWKLKRAFSGSADKSIRLWNLARGECIRLISGHLQGVRSLCIDWELGVALSSAWDGVMQLWEIADEVDEDFALQPVGGEVRIGGVALLTVKEGAEAENSEEEPEEIEADALKGKQRPT
eukprot:s57_g6.t1